MPKMGGRGSLSDLRGLEKRSGENICVADKGKDTGKMGGLVACCVMNNAFINILLW